MTIDIFSHILTKKYLETLNTKGSGKYFNFLRFHTECTPLVNIHERFRLMDANPDILQVLTMAGPPLETLVSKKDAVDIAQIANDELAEIVEKYPDRFVAAAANLPLNDIDASIEEINRVVNELNFKGVQIYTCIDERPLDDIRFRPLFERINHHNLIIWMHCWHSSFKEGVEDIFMGMLGWDFETSLAMVRLVMSGIINDNPDMKIITHHCGGMIPINRGRVKEMLGEKMADVYKFYNDTLLTGNTSGLMCGYDFFGADHLLFGTDFPLGGRPDERISEEIKSVKDMQIPDEHKIKIFEGNAKKILDLGGS